MDINLPYSEKIIGLANEYIEASKENVFEYDFPLKMHHFLGDKRSSLVFDIQAQETQLLYRCLERMGLVLIRATQCAGFGYFYPNIINDPFRLEIFKANHHCFLTQDK